MTTAIGYVHHPVKKVVHRGRLSSVWRPGKDAHEQGSFNWEVLQPYDPRRNMLPSNIIMSTPPEQAANVSDDRILPGDLRRNVPNTLDCRSTPDGDVVYVQPPFVESLDRSDTPPLASAFKKDEWQTRSPQEDDKQIGGEFRNPSSPAKRSEESRHTRNLSAHFSDAASLMDRDENRLARIDDVDDSARKHRRVYSGDSSNPAVAHRRINSIGNSSAVRRIPGYHHQREGSAGLEMLSAAANVSKDEIAAVAGPGPRSASAWDAPQVPRPHRASIGQVSTGSYEYAQPPGPASHHPNMNPPPPPRHMSPYAPPPPHPYGHPFPPPSQHQYHPPPYPPHPYYTQAYVPTPRGMPPHGYPVQYSQRPPEPFTKSMYQTDIRSEHMSSTDYRERKDEVGPPSLNHQGSQTFVTAISVGSGAKVIQPGGAPRTASESPVPVGFGNSRHHRKMSSYSSLGTLLGPTIFSPGAGEAHPLKEGHHRSISSVSFLQVLDTGFDQDDPFLRNLQASNAVAAERTPTPSSTPEPTPPSPTSSGTKLASGGTSKRVRRKCTVEGCVNRVVQGGLCITHGARRKQCKHPGCNKNVKKAGLCSTHGPARKRCEAEGCLKVAVQGGRCIAHGAKKKLCCVKDCTKQAILGGMCKKHHDQNQEEETTTVEYCQDVPTTSSNSHKPTHTRGLSIFGEISADAVKTLLNADSKRESPTGAGGGGSGAVW